MSSESGVRRVLYCEGLIRLVKDHYMFIRSNVLGDVYCHKDADLWGDDDQMQKRYTIGDVVSFSAVPQAMRKGCGYQTMSVCKKNQLKTMEAVVEQVDYVNAYIFSPTVGRIFFPVRSKNSEGVPWTKLIGEKNLRLAFSSGDPVKVTVMPQPEINSCKLYAVQVDKIKKEDIAMKEEEPMLKQKPNVHSPVVPKHSRVVPLMNLEQESLSKTTKNTAAQCEPTAEQLFLKKVFADNEIKNLIFKKFANTPDEIIGILKFT